MKNKLNIELYRGREVSEKRNADLQTNAISRFIFAFKILLRSSYKIEAIFDEISFDANRKSSASGAISLVIASGDKEQDKELFLKLRGKKDSDMVFIVCFEQDHYNALVAIQQEKVYPLFYETTNGKVLTFQDFFIDEAESGSLLFLKIFDLIDAIQESMNENWTTNSSKDTIYLALTDGKLNEERNILKRELRRLGYKVAPDATGMNKDDFNPQLSEAIEKSKLSIHLIHPGELSGMNKSISLHQSELAFQKYKNSGDTFSRILWIAGPENEDDLESIERLKDSTEELMGAEVLQNSIETLKGLLKYKLNGHSSNGTIHYKTISKNLKVYFLYDKIDEKSATALISTLKLDDQDLLLPKFRGDFYQLRNHHIDCLKEADMVVVYIEHVNPIWLQMKFLEILKSPGMGREKKWLNQIIYLNTRQKIEWLEGNKEKMTVLENDVKELANKIELGRKMLNHEANL